MAILWGQAYPLHSPNGLKDLGGYSLWGHTWPCSGLAPQAPGDAARFSSFPRDLHEALRPDLPGGPHSEAAGPPLGGSTQAAPPALCP